VAKAGTAFIGAGLKQVGQVGQQGLTATDTLLQDRGKLLLLLLLTPRTWTKAAK
jgi:hypothetical protein